jgi:hypothetical protein
VEKAIRIIRTLFFLFFFLMSNSLMASGWELDSQCEPHDFYSRVKEFLQGKSFWRNQYSEGGKEIQATEQLITITMIDLNKKLATGEATLQAEAAELAVKGIPADLIAMTIQMSAQNFKKEVEFSVMLIRETYPTHIRYLQDCLSKIRGRM